MRGGLGTGLRGLGRGLNSGRGQLLNDAWLVWPPALVIVHPPLVLAGKPVEADPAERVVRILLLSVRGVDLIVLSIGVTRGDYANTPCYFVRVLNARAERHGVSLGGEEYRGAIAAAHSIRMLDMQPHGLPRGAKNKRGLAQKSTKF